MSGGTYLVTGGCGFLGQHIVKAIHDRDPAAEIRVLDLNPRSTWLNIETIPGVKLLFGDLSRPKSFTVALKSVDIVVHCAALVSFKPGDEDFLYRSNIGGTVNLLEAARKHGCRDFLYISSISAIGREPNQLSNETMSPNPDKQRQTDPYGFSKLYGEHLLRAHKSSMRTIILNPSVILGPGSSRLAKIIASLRWIPCCPMITTLNSFVDVRDVATAVVLALERGRSGERYIVTTENVGMIPFMKMVLSLMGKNTPVIPIPPIFLILADFVLRLMDTLQINPGLRKLKEMNVDKIYSAKKIKYEIGWQPQYSLEKSLYDTIKFSVS